MGINLSLRSILFLNTSIVTWRSHKVRAIFPLNFFTMGERETDLTRNSGTELDFKGCFRLSVLLSIPDSNDIDDILPTDHSTEIL